jgi:hypothetical protein
MRSIILLAVVVSCLVIGFRFSDQPIASPPMLQEDQGNIGFDWAFGVLKQKGKTVIPVPITRDTTLKSGDEIKMMVKPTKECYVYVIYYGSQGELSLLFPYTIRQLQTDYIVDKPYYIPPARDWLKLDTVKGNEKFFVVASNTRILSLEAKLGNYFSVDPMKRQPLVEDIVSEIRGLRKQYASFATIAEKPQSIGGNIRGTDTVEAARRPDVADIAINIQANNFYSKTFTIDHQ